jgi:putative phosphoribosyl transferase
MELAQRELVGIAAGRVRMEGMLELPAELDGIVLFAHGSGSSRHSPRNNFVAAQLRERGLGTLLLDLLTPQEERDLQTRFDIELLTGRLDAACEWLNRRPETAREAVGLFGASTGAAAALRLAAQLGTRIAAVVSRGGRPDLAGAMPLAAVTAPTLLIVGGGDGPVIDVNRGAYAQLKGEKDMVIVPGAGHLFEEAGAMEQVAELAARWFRRHLGR